MIKTECKIRGLGSMYNASYKFFQKNIEAGRGDKTAIYYGNRSYTLSRNRHPWSTNLEQH